MKNFACLLLCALFASCAREPRPDLLLVTVDTLRADRVGCYGYAAAHTPFMDQLASEGVRYAQCMSPVPVTLPAHASMLTGLLPAEHGVRNNLSYALPQEVESVAETLRAAGYATGAFVSAMPLAARFGLAQGFEHYDDQLEAAPAVFSFAERPAPATVQAALRWLNEQPADRPIFLWVHLFEPHAPYEPPAPLDEELAHPYDGEVAAVDAALRLLHAGLLEARGGAPITLLTADHGEGLGEHGEETHSFFLYESTLHVPLIVHAPGVFEPAVVAEPVSLCDVAPTLLHFAGLRVPQTSGVVLGNHGMPQRALFAETLYGLEAFGWSPMVARREGSQKVIRSAVSRAYDLAADPRERNDLAPAAPDWLTGAFARTDAEIRRWETQQPDAARASSAAEQEALAALGYVSGGSPAQGALLEAMRERPDGSAQLDEFELLSEAQQSIEASAYDQALQLLQQIRERNPRNGFAMGLLAGVHKERGEFDEALEVYLQACAVDPRRLEHHINAARMLRGLGREAEALTHYEAALALRPLEFELLRESCQQLVGAGKVELVLGALDETLRRRAQAPAPERAELHALYAICALRAQRPQDALPHVQEARALDDSPQLAVVEAQYLRSQREWDRIRELLRPLREQLQNDDQAQLLLGLAEDQSGHPAEAIEHYRRSLELHERQFVAHSRLATLLLNTAAGPQAALPHAARAVELGSDQAHAHVIYVDILMRLGNEQIARNHVARFGPQFADDADFATLYERVGLARN